MKLEHFFQIYENFASLSERLELYSMSDLYYLCSRANKMFVFVFPHFMCKISA